MRPKWPKLASLAQKIFTLWFQFFNAFFASKGYPFKNIFDFTTAGDWDCVAAVGRLPTLHYSVVFIFLSFGIMFFDAFFASKGYPFKNIYVQFSDTEYNLPLL